MALTTTILYLSFWQRYRTLAVLPFVLFFVVLSFDLSLTSFYLCLDLLCLGLIPCLVSPFSLAHSTVFCCLCREGSRSTRVGHRRQAIPWLLVGIQCSQPGMYCLVVSCLVVLSCRVLSCLVVVLFLCKRNEIRFAAIILTMSCLIVVSCSLASAFQGALPSTPYCSHDSASLNTSVDVSRVPQQQVCLELRLRLRLGLCFGSSLLWRCLCLCLGHWLALLFGLSVRLLFCFWPLSWSFSFVSLQQVACVDVLRVATTTDSVLMRNSLQIFLGKTHTSSLSFLSFRALSHGVVILVFAPPPFFCFALVSCLRPRIFA
jgi:hypothetical protein